ncbi:MAG: DUF91 domain-containing protein [Alphaproteobacteria bacterium]|nr:DUF91 domain-containing protein [Alphaproteobacteria bacterium]
MYRAAEFAGFFLGQGNTQNSLNYYKTVLKRVDQAVGGLDEKLATEGPEAVLRWSRTPNAEPLKPYLKDVPSIVRKYVEFFQAAPNSEVPLEGVEATPELPAEVEVSQGFLTEREMQRAVRAQLDALEPGLKLADGGFETTVTTGRIDILAEDVGGKLVVIELKAGACPPGALEQVQGYAEAIEIQTGRPARAIVIAGSFPDRMRSAAKRNRDLQLRSYDFQLRFNPVI